MKWLRMVRDIYSDSVFGCPVLWRQGAPYEKKGIWSNIFRKKRGCRQRGSQAPYLPFCM